MHKVKLSWGKFSIITVLSLGFMVLGIGCISWAMYSMWSQPQSNYTAPAQVTSAPSIVSPEPDKALYPDYPAEGDNTVSYTHLRAHETRHDIVCRLLLENKKTTK